MTLTCEACRPGAASAPCGSRSNTRRKDESGEWVDKPNYFSVTVWGAQGENCNRFLSKGRPVAIDGRLEWREWKDKEGNKRESVEIIADSVQFLGSPSRTAAAATAAAAATGSPRTRTSRPTRRTSRRSPSAPAPARRPTTTSRSRPGERVAADRGGATRRTRAA